MVDAADRITKGTQKAYLPPILPLHQVRAVENARNIAARGPIAGMGAGVDDSGVYSGIEPTAPPIEQTMLAIDEPAPMLEPSPIPSPTSEVEADQPIELLESVSVQMHEADAPLPVSDIETQDQPEPPPSAQETLPNVPD